MVALSPAHAGESATSDQGDTGRLALFEISPFIGYMAGTSREYVFQRSSSGTSVLSKLNWRTDSAATAGLRAAFHPLSWFTLSGQVWTVVASNARVSDYDWLYRAEGVNLWSDWSGGPVQRMNRTYGLDLHAEAVLARPGPFVLSGLAGYQYETLKWVNASSGLDNINTSSLDAFRQSVGHSAGTGLMYKQQWRSPYLGIGVNYASGRFGIETKVIVSPWVSGRDRDFHPYRNVLFVERGQPSSMIGLDVEANYRIAARWTVFAGIDYQKFSVAKADTWITSLTTRGSSWLPSGSAGLSSETYGAKFGVTLAF